MMNIPNEDGYELWLCYHPVDNAERLTQYRKALGGVVVLGKGATAEIIRSELARAQPALLDAATPISTQTPEGNALVIGTTDALESLGVTLPQAQRDALGEEGFLIRSHPAGTHTWIVVTGNAETAILTGVFHFLRLLQTHQDIGDLDIASRPRIRRRIHAHWDNLDGSIERGYAGKSLWQWDELPERIDPRYHDYARACASIGLNGVCLNNVNANPKSLTAEYLRKAAALADVFRPYGIRVYLAPFFAAPIRLGSLRTSDPRDPAVAAWWREKVDEIYRLIPDFGGFQVKANSEGQPGPQDYGANHDEGANMLAEALAPHGGTLLWRAFVYDVNVDADRAECAYKEFVPLDGTFRPNIFVQAKNGPIDFQPREPFHPLFGALEQTPLALELQIAQEYLGQSIHLVERSASGRTVESHNARFVAGLHRLHDAARPASHYAGRPSLRARSRLRQRAATGLELRLLPPGRCGGPGLRPQQHRQPGQRAVSQPLARAVRQPGDLPGKVSAVVSSRALGSSHTVRAHALGGTPTPVR